MKTENSKAQMRKGILEYCTLLLLERKDCYSSEIISALKKNELIIVEGTLYPLLTRLKNAKLLAYHWEESSQGPPRKYYKLTENGKSFLKDLDKSWEEIVKTIKKIKNIKT
ncbi:MAG: PadR family transcriptional regulator [Bacteroidetes bacterium HGW-Bacteroidetes-12]|nr:MAG: PadR family transcriptional regulator [Bacteroidetes bacterium HGW-Bacteroidetes-12]